MKISKQLFFVGALVAVVTMGCDKKKQQEVLDKAGLGGTDKGNFAELAGTYGTSCSGETILPNFKSGREEYQFNIDGSFSKKHYFFSDDNCSSPSIVRTEYGKIHFPHDTKITNGAGAPINFDFQRVEVEGDNQASVDLLNGMNYCGTKFTVSKAADLSAQSRGDATRGLVCMGLDKTPRQTYDTIKIDGNKINLGNDAKETNQDKRPDVSDKEVLTKE